MKKRIKKLLNKIICYLSDCDGMCGFYDICKYCQICQKE